MTEVVLDALRRPAEIDAMKYEDFKAAFEDALKESKLRMMGLWGDESLDVRSLDRTYEVHVEPLGGQDAEPFFVAATISFRWDALNTARTNTREEDMLTELFGQDGDLRLRAVSISAMQIMQTPRIFDDPAKEDAGPYDDLREMFHRVRASLSAWMQALDHLKKGAPARPKADDPLTH